MTGIGSSLVALTRVRADLTRIAAPPLLFVGRAEAASRFWEFFANRIRNVHTRRAYYRAVCRFADAIGARQVSDLAAGCKAVLSQSLFLMNLESCRSLNLWSQFFDFARKTQLCDRTVLPPSIDVDEGFIDAPRLAHRSRETIPAVLKFRDEVLHPPIDRTWCHTDSAFEHHLGQISVR